MITEERQRFPVDMLRYDACFPAHEHDSAVLAPSGPRPLPESRGRRVVQLQHLSRDRAWQPSERWASFGWRVVERLSARRL